MWVKSNSKPGKQTGKNVNKWNEQQMWKGINFILFLPLLLGRRAHEDASFCLIFF
jgi:hypothetical protein